VIYNKREINASIKLAHTGFRRGDEQGGQSVPDRIMDNC